MLVQSRHNYYLIVIKLVLIWKNAHLVLNNNHSLTHASWAIEFSVNDRLFCEESCVGIDDEEYKKVDYIQHIDAITIFGYTGR
jgi:hypothetical protein